MHQEAWGRRLRRQLVVAMLTPSPSLSALCGECCDFIEQSCALVADPEAAWARFGETGDGAMLSSIAPDLKLLTPATGEEVTLGNLVGNGKGLVVFMRHIG